MVFILRNLYIIAMLHHDFMSDRLKPSDKKYIYHVKMTKYYIDLYETLNYKKELKEKLKEI